MAIGLAHLIVSCTPPVTPAPKAATINKLNRVYHTIRVLESENHLSIGEQLRRITNAITLQDKWTRLVVESMAKDGIDETIARETLCQDGYGNLFNIDFKTSLIAKGAPNKLTGVEFDVIIWSSGENGINEDGQGDDIFLPAEKVPR